MDSNLPKDNDVPFPANKDLSGSDAHSFAALRRLYVQMGFLLHEHGIQTLQQLESLLKSTPLKDGAPEAANKPSAALPRLEDQGGPTELVPPSQG
jgi:hypothetical protein